MEQNLLNIGFGSTVVADRVVAIVSPNSAPMKRLKDEAKKTSGSSTRPMAVEPVPLSLWTATTSSYPPFRRKPCLSDIRSYRRRVLIVISLHFM